MASRKWHREVKSSSARRGSVSAGNCLQQLCNSAPSCSRCEAGWQRLTGVDAEVRMMLSLTRQLGAYSSS